MPRSRSNVPGCGRIIRPHTSSSPLTPDASRLPAALPIPEEYSAEQQLQHEIEAFGFPLSRHPLELCNLSVGEREYVRANEMAGCIGKTVTMIGWFITGK